MGMVFLLGMDRIDVLMGKSWPRVYGSICILQHY